MGKTGETPKDSMEETGDGTVHSPSGSSNIVRADIVACMCTFQVLAKSYVNRCNRGSEESGLQSFHEIEETATDLRYVPYEQRRIPPRHRIP